jgi:hypothetical protein
MEDELIPGDLTSDPTDPFFANSMAEKIEQQLDTLMAADGLPHLSTDVSDPTVRDRRRLFVAIARGVVLHLAQHPGAFIRDDASIAFPLTRINHA